MVDLQYLSALAERTVSMATHAGADRCDVVAADTDTISVDLEKGSVKQANIFSDPGVGVRAFVKGASGFAVCTGFDDAAVSRAAAMAVSLARAGTPDNDFKDLPVARQVRTLPGLYEPRVAEIGPDEVVSMVIEMSDIAGDHNKVTSSNASAAVSVCQVALANSNSFSSAQRMTSVDLVVESVARDGDAMFSGYDGCSGRRLEQGTIERVSTTARDQAVKGLVQTKLETGDYAIIMDPLAAGFVLGNAIGGGLNADSVQRGRSFLAGKLGQVIGSPAVTVYDDPTIEWASGSTSFDGEGVTAARSTLVDKGRLASYLYDSYAAGKESRASTGNSSRGGSVWSYRHPPSISTTNLVVSPGDSSFDEMVRETRSGAYVRATFDYPNLATGEFSGLMMESYVIRDGELGPAIRQSTMGIGIVDMLSRVDMVGKKPRDYFGVQTPPFRISSARIAGSG
ncbi:MAG TPA: TldD/PmbA family protein [Thermoplasmata archaeon]|nr:TldD/PmbA family protein [Thermoplasmata archaeon]